MWSKHPGAVAALLIAIGVARIASTYTTFSFTTDEPMHISAGLELLQQHRYTLQPENPPLPRIVLAALPDAGGIRWDGPGNFYQKADRAFFSAGDYRKKLVLSRTGNLLFFILAAIAVFVLARRWLGDLAAILAVLLFTTQPIILGYSGIANHDAAATAGVGIALIAMDSWLRRPDVKRASALGAAFGFAVLCKFSCLLFAPVACAAMLIVRLIRRRSDPDVPRVRIIDVFTCVAIVAIAGFAVVWAGYGFTVGPFDGRMIPAPAFFRGIRGVIALEGQRFESYAFGRTTTRGWWWYFPVAVILKTTLPFLILVIVGGHVASRSLRLRWPCIESLAAAAAIVGPAMKSSLDLGVRYVMPAYVPLTVAAAAAGMALLEGQRRWMRRTGIALVALHIVSSVIAHPDYFPYFNALAGREPGRCLVDSNLDWGQDLLRLADIAGKRRIDTIGIDIPGNRATNAEFEAAGLRRAYRLDPYLPRTGWLAVGEHFYRIDHEAWRWLDRFPMQRVGTSIRLYDVPQNSGTIGNESVEFEQVLLPLAGTTSDIGAGGGARWRIDQTIQNRGTNAVYITRTNCEKGASACALKIQPGETVRIAGSDPIRPFIYLAVPRAAMPSLDFSTVARRVDRVVPESDVVVPAVAGSQFTATPLEFEGMNFSDRTRLNLRLYIDERGISSTATIRVLDGTRLVGQAKVPIYMTGYYTHGDIASLFPDLRRSGKRLTITVDCGARAWAFVTSTEADGRSAVYLPEPSL